MSGGKLRRSWFAFWCSECGILRRE